MAPIRDASPSEASSLSDLTLRSKGYWGYDAQFMEDCRAELTLSTDYVERHYVRAIDVDGRVAGFYSLVDRGREVQLDHLWIDPAAMGLGLGRLLWSEAVERARSDGFDAMIIHSDPHAEGFYLHMGAERTGEIESTIRPGRYLPLLRFKLR